MEGPSLFSLRLADVALEDGRLRAPLAGLFLDLRDVPLIDALAPIRRLLPRNGSIIVGAGLDQVLVKAREARERYKSLSEDQCACIVLYTAEEPGEREQSVYYALNAALRSADRAQMRPWRDFTWLLLRGLQGLPPRPVPRVLRGVACSFDAMGGIYAPGALVQWSGFSSTAEGALNVIVDFVGDAGDRTIFQIELCEGTGRDVSAFSFYRKEAELLIPPNLMMRVGEVTRDVLGSPGLVLVELKQARKCGRLPSFRCPKSPPSPYFPSPHTHAPLLSSHLAVHFPSCSASPFILRSSPFTQISLVLHPRPQSVLHPRPPIPPHP